MTYVMTGVVGIQCQILFEMYSAGSVYPHSEMRSVDQS